MVGATLERLRTTCFGAFCEVGECFETSVISLRFVGTVTPHETEWVRTLVEGYKNHLNDKKRHSGIVFYYFLCLSELPPAIAEPEIEMHQDRLLQLIKRSFVMNSEQDKYMSPLYKYILRNCLARIPQYAYLKDRAPHIDDRDGRLHFKMEPIG